MKRFLLICLAVLLGLSLTGCKREIVSDRVSEEEWKEILSADYDSFTVNVKNKQTYDGKTYNSEYSIYYIDGLQFREYQMKLTESSPSVKVIDYTLWYKDFAFFRNMGISYQANEPYLYYTASVKKQNYRGLFSDYIDEYESFSYVSSAKGYKKTNENGDILILKFKDGKAVELKEKTDYYSGTASITDFNATEVEKPINYFIEDDNLFELVDGKYYFLASFKEAEDIILPKTIKGENYAIKHLSVLENTKSLTLPETIISIDKDAVLDSCQFEKIQFLGTVEQWNIVLSKTSLSSQDFFRGPSYNKISIQIQCSDSE
ncbi:MAG: hypothetical protein K2J93_06780 [Anaeroplasmataceae bacterium]|nr:hypothetical protein [Anaeroplasmataceae bacterium]